MNKTKRMAICYDFDKTLAPDDMQSFTLIPSFGVDKDDFWKEVNEIAKASNMDTNLAWMHLLIKHSQFNNLKISKEYFREIGADVKLYEGVISWMQRTSEYALSKGIELEHYIISSGLKEIIEGSEVAKYVKKIYASSYMYSPDDVAIWPAQAVNYTTKTQYIFRIAKGCLEEYDESVNEIMPDSELRIPHENIVYIGDSATDIPCMRLVKSRGGYSIGVYDKSAKNTDRVKKLYKDRRISYYAPADYNEGSELDSYLKKVIDNIASEEALKDEERGL